MLGKLKEWQATIRASQRLGKDPPDSFEMNFLFTGAPGDTRCKSMAGQHNAVINVAARACCAHILSHIRNGSSPPLCPPCFTGTGKTTVARRVGMLFHSLGLLSSSEVVSCSASDFITGYAGQSGNKTREMFKKAVGQVLFIDEAYRQVWDGPDAVIDVHCIALHCSAPL